jgi:hypothetical protein
VVGSSAKPTKTAGYREMAHRANTFIEVTLLWRQADNSVLLRLVEVAERVEFELHVRPENALDAFNHPYAYLPGRLLEPASFLAA